MHSAHILTGLSIACAVSACAREPEAPAALPASAEKSARHIGEHGEVVLHVDAAQRESMGLVLAELAPTTLAPYVATLARISADPAASGRLRASVAGTLHARDGVTWPAPGTRIASGAELGFLEARLSPMERADLEARVITARGEVQGAMTELEAARAEAARAQDLNARDKAISDRALEEARGRVKLLEAHAAAAKESVEALQAALAATGTDGRMQLPLRASSSGEVVTQGARPGENVEPGALLLEWLDLSALQVRVPAPLALAAPPAKVELTPVADGAARIEARFVRRESATDPMAITQSWIYAIAPEQLARAAPREFRPGELVRVFLATGAAPSAGFDVPRSAVLRHAGKSWVFVARGPEELAREELATDIETGAGWFTRASWAQGAHVVTGGAQNVLSFELLGQAAAGNEE